MKIFLLAVFFVSMISCNNRNDVISTSNKIIFNESYCKDEPEWFSQNLKSLQSKKITLNCWKDKIYRQYSSNRVIGHEQLDR